MNKLLEIALGQVGITEIKGDVDNPEVMKYYHETGRKWVGHDETPWCDAFLDWCAMRAGYKFSPGLLARAWLKEGTGIANPKLGDICILWRKSKDSIYGHVGIFIRKNSDAVWLLGGNQGIGQVNIRPYSLNKVLGYRRLT